MPIAPANGSRHNRPSHTPSPDVPYRFSCGKVVTATVRNDQLAWLTLRPDETHPVSDAASRITYSTDDGHSAARLAAGLAADGVAIGDLDIASPTLDDVFTHLMSQGAQP